MVRALAGLVFATLLATGAASASSFVTPEPMTAKLGPSMIALGEPASEQAAATDDQAEPADAPADVIAKAIDKSPLDYPFPVASPPAVYSSEGSFVRVSPSIIAMGKSAPAVSYEQVAAFEKDAGDNEAERRNPFEAGPTVIRGGVVDNGGPAEYATPAMPTTKPVANRPSTVAGTQAAPGRAASSSSRQPPEQPDVPIPSPTPAPPPANIIPQTRVQ